MTPHLRARSLAELIDAENARLFHLTEAAFDALEADEPDRRDGLTIAGTCETCGRPWSYVPDGPAVECECPSNREELF